MKRILSGYSLLLAGATLLILSCGCTRGALRQSAVLDVYTAEMRVTAEGRTSSSIIWARPGLLRMSLDGGRAASGMIARYEEGRCWALIPGAMLYQEFPIETLRSRVPHFFDPALKVEKTFLARDVVEGIPALKYDAIIEHPRFPFYRGILWEAEALPGYPLKWEDADRDVVVLWKKPVLVEKPESFFMPPEGYAEQRPVPPDPSKKESSCNKR